MLRGLWTLLILVFATALFGPPAILVALLGISSDFTMRMGRYWAGTILWATGAEIRYHGRRFITARLPCIYICNHLSNLDIWALQTVIPSTTRFVAKQSLFRVPVIGWAMTASGFIGIDRQNRARAIRSLTEAVGKIRGGRSVILFPEGTRSRDGQLGSFKKGPFHLALQAGVPIVPVTIHGSGAVLPPGTIRLTPGPVDVRFHPPIELAPFLPDDLEGLMSCVRGLMVAALHEPE